jgi:hypothetical protein
MRATLSLLLLLAVAGCAKDPFKQPGTWSLPPDGLGANDANLRTMIANPGDLVAGTGEPASLASQSTRSIDLLVTGHRRPLPSVNASQIGGGNQGSQAGGEAQGQGGAGGPAGTQ